MYLYIKALHIIFIVTWFAGLFYVVRLFIYTTEAQDKAAPDKQILTDQLLLMTKRLWLGITWPSAVLTIIFGGWVAWMSPFFSPLQNWMAVKLVFVSLLYAYHFTLHRLFSEEKRGYFRFSSTQLRIWNEVATIFLIAIVMLATVKQGMSWAWGIAGLVLFTLLLLSAIKIYKLIRAKDSNRA